VEPIFREILDSALAGMATVITGLFAFYVPRIITAVQNKLNIQLTQQQIASLSAAATTGAALLTQKIRAGELKPTGITPTSPAVIEQASAALKRVPAAAAGQATTVDALAAVIAARVDTQA
jgi:hypothetical protein